MQEKPETPVSPSLSSSEDDFKVLCPPRLLRPPSQLSPPAQPAPADHPSASAPSTLLPHPPSHPNPPVQLHMLQSLCSVCRASCRSTLMCCSPQGQGKEAVTDLWYFFPDMSWNDQVPPLPQRNWCLPGAEDSTTVFSPWGPWCRGGKDWREAADPLSCFHVSWGKSDFRHFGAKIRIFWRWNTMSASETRKQNACTIRMVRVCQINIFQLWLWYNNNFKRKNTLKWLSSQSQTLLVLSFNQVSPRLF